MLFKKGNNPFGKVIQPPDSVGHSISVILSHHPATKESLQCVEELNITSMLNDREFGEYLILAGHLWMRVDADVETTFAVNESHHPFGFLILMILLNVLSPRGLPLYLLSPSC